jgi:hypothetical protein
MMRTRTKRSFQPELSGLEGRQLLSTVGSPTAVDRTSLGSRALLEYEIMVATPKAGHTSHAAAEGVKAVDRTSPGSRALLEYEIMVATPKAGHTSHAAAEGVKAVDRTSLGSRALLEYETMVATPKAGHTSHAPRETSTRAEYWTATGHRFLT